MGFFRKSIMHSFSGVLAVVGKEVTSLYDILTLQRSTSRCYRIGKSEVFSVGGGFVSGTAGYPSHVSNPK